MASRGIIYEYEDGGRYCGEWENDAAHGHGVCTGPEGNGLFQGLWEKGHQSSGVFTWPSGQKYMGKWRQGVREGAGKETKKDGTEYCGEFTRDSRGPYGVLRQPNGVMFKGTWKEGVQNGLGTEVYIDGGVYRGEYLNGMRHGHGTRSSSNYERSMTVETTSLSSSASIENLASTLEDPSSVTCPVSTSNSQVYEGEWQGDRRHGYGVLKMVGHHTYYGQWEDNMRSGYGVMVYGEEKRKEEGQWQRGKLVQKLKRKKLQLKWKQLESKMSQAHTSALQAAELARSKADLAEGRANTASAKARLAVRAAQQAVKDAEAAESIEKTHRNAPKVQESAKSPVTDSYTAGDISRGLLFPPSDALHLKVPQYIPLTPSFEDIASVARDHPLPPPGNNDSTSSSESLEEAESTIVGGARQDEEAWSNWESPSPIPWRGRLHGQLTVARVQERRERFQGKRHSSADLLLRKRETEETEESRGGGGSLGEETPSLKEKRKILMKIHQATESDPAFSPRLGSGRGEFRTVSSMGTIRQAQVKGGGGRKNVGELRTRHIYKATGEPDHGGEATDDEEMSMKSAVSVNSAARDQLPAPRTSLSVDVLQEMARWNKMVAYLNLALLFFLLLLIMTVVLCMNYYWLVYQMPASAAGTTGGAIGSQHFAAGPIA